jgi:hypothetical protein
MHELGTILRTCNEPAQEQLPWLLGPLAGRFARGRQLLGTGAAENLSIDSSPL